MATKLVARTHFRKAREQQGKKSVYQWRWATKTPDEVDTVGVGGEGYDGLAGVINGFMSQQGHPEWEPIVDGPGDHGFTFPKGYAFQRITDEHYVLSHITEEV